MARIRYSQEQFFRLMDMVTEQGGRHLDEPHLPMYVKDWTGDMRESEEIVYCGQDTMFSVPYFYKEGEKREAVMCALCDMMGYMPKFAAAMEAQ